MIRLLDMKGVVPAHHDPEDAVPGRGGEQNEQDHVVDVFEAEPPPGEIEHALHAKEREDSEGPALVREDAPQRVHHLREVFNGMRYVVRGGGAWRMLPNDLPPWAAV